MQLLEPTRNRGGRPRVAEPRIPVSTRVTPNEFDALCRAATANNVSVSELLRIAVKRLLPRPAPRQDE